MPPKSNHHTPRSFAPGSSAYYACLFVPAHQRPTIYAIMDFCRTLQDIKKLSHMEAAAPKLDWWYAEIEQLYTGSPLHPSTQALQTYLPTYAWPRAWFESYLSGIRADLLPTTYQTVADIEFYHYCTAGVVSMLCAQVLGIQNTQTLHYAQKLGNALQWMHHIRHIGTDAKAQRIYLPTADCLQFGVTPTLIFARQPHPQITALLKFEAQRAIACYEDAIAHLHDIDRAAQRGSIIFGHLRRQLLEEIIHQDSTILQQGITLTPLRKLWLAWTKSLQERKKEKIMRIL